MHIRGTANILDADIKNTKELDSPRTQAKFSLVWNARVLCMKFDEIRTIASHVGVPMAQRWLIDAERRVLLPNVAPPRKCEPRCCRDDSEAPRREARVDLEPAKVFTLRPIGGAGPKLVVDGLCHCFPRSTRTRCRGDYLK